MRQGFHWKTAVAVVLVAGVIGGCSDVVQLPDCIDCRPVEMSLDQSFEVELGGDRSVSNDPEAYAWIVTDAGTMELVSQEWGTRPEDESEFVGGYSSYVVYAFEPTVVGTTEMRFAFQPTYDPAAPPGNTLDITVIVNE